MVSKLHHHKVGHIETVNQLGLRKNCKSSKQHCIDFCEHDLTMLSIELDLDPKIKVVALNMYYNFA